MAPPLQLAQPLLYTKSKTNGWPAAISRGYHIVIDLTTAVCTALASTVYIPQQPLLYCEAAKNSDEKQPVAHTAGGGCGSLMLYNTEESPLCAPQSKGTVVWLELKPTQQGICQPYIDAAHSYGVAGEGQCSGKALGRPYSMEQTFHQIWYGHAHGAFACLASSLVIPSSAIALKERVLLLAHALLCFQRCITA